MFVFGQTIALVGLRFGPRGLGPSTGFFRSVPIFVSSMNHTTRLLGIGINCFQPLDGRKWMVIIYLGYHKTAPNYITLLIIITIFSTSSDYVHTLSKFIQLKKIFNSKSGSSCLFLKL
jgi:hypothetical protein